MPLFNVLSANRGSSRSPVHKRIAFIDALQSVSIYALCPDRGTAPAQGLPSAARREQLAAIRDACFDIGDAAAFDESASAHAQVATRNAQRTSADAVSRPARHERLSSAR